MKKPKKETEGGATPKIDYIISFASQDARIGTEGETSPMVERLFTVLEMESKLYLAQGEALSECQCKLSEAQREIAGYQKALSLSMETHSATQQALSLCLKLAERYQEQLSEYQRRFGKLEDVVK